MSQALKEAMVTLSQPNVDNDRSMYGARNTVSGQDAAPEITGEYDIYIGVLQSPGNGLNLLNAAKRDPAIKVSLKSSFSIPKRLRVPYQYQISNDFAQRRFPAVECQFTTVGRYTSGRNTTALVLTTVKVSGNTDEALLPTAYRLATLLSSSISKRSGVSRAPQPP